MFFDLLTPFDSHAPQCVPGEGSKSVQVSSYKQPGIRLKIGRESSSRNLDADDAKYNIIAYNSNEIDLFFAEKNRSR